MGALAVAGLLAAAPISGAASGWTKPRLTGPQPSDQLVDPNIQLTGNERGDVALVWLVGCCRHEVAVRPAGGEFEPSSAFFTDDADGTVVAVDETGGVTVVVRRDPDDQRRGDRTK